MGVGSSETRREEAPPLEVDGREVVLERPGRVAGVPSGLRLSVSRYSCDRKMLRTLIRTISVMRLTRKFPRMREGDQRKPSVHLRVRKRSVKRFKSGEGRGARAVGAGGARLRCHRSVLMTPQSKLQPPPRADDRATNLLIPLSSSSKTNTLPLLMSLRSRSASRRVTLGMSRRRAASRIKSASSVVSRNPTHGGSVHCC